MKKALLIAAAILAHPVASSAETTPPRALSGAMNVSLSAMYLSLDGKVYATEDTFDSEGMKAQDLHDRGLYEIVLYQIGLSFPLGRRLTLSTDYVFGSAEGTGDLGHDLGYNDTLFLAQDDLGSSLVFDSLAVQIRWRAFETKAAAGAHSVELGAGIISLRSYFELSSDLQDTADEENFFAPHSLLLDARYIYGPGSGYYFEADLSGVVYSLIWDAINLNPSEAHYFRLDLAAGRPLGRYADLAFGASIWNLKIDFDAVEKAHYLFARNEIEMWMAGGFVRFEFGPAGK